ncbi:MAG: twin-arginine translocase TatA/TatE family subunit [Chthoniobacterales bacterium]
MIFLAFMNIGGQELILLLLIILVLFGAKRLPELARGMGQAIKEFQKAKDEFADELHSAGKNEPPKPEVRPAPATMPRIENVAGETVVRQDAAQVVEPRPDSTQV